MKYLRVSAEGAFESSTVYEPLDPLTEYTEDDLTEMAKDLVNNLFTWGHSVVDESEVPYDDR